MRPSLRLAALAVSALTLLAGCDAFGEPERFYNDDARPPAVGTLDLARLQDGQHVAGSVAIALDLDSLAGRLDRVVLWIDGNEVESRTQPPFRFRIYTPGYSEGAHTVSAAAYVRQPNGGLLNLAGAPAVALTARLVFDQRPPTPVALTSVEMEVDRARLRWTANTDPNFYAYLIVRSATWTEPSGWYDGTPVVDTLYDRNATTYLDAPFPNWIGARAEYRVLAWNRQDVSDSPAAVSAVYGTQVPGLSYATVAGFSRDGNEMYALTATSLVALSTADHRERRRLEYTALAPGGPVPDRARLSRAGTELFMPVASGEGFSRRVHVVDVASLRAVRSFALPDGAVTFELGLGGELYSAGRGRLSVLDRQTGAVTTRTGVLFSDLAHVVAVSPDGASVYVEAFTSDDYGTRATLHRVDVSGAAPQLAASFDWPQRVSGQFGVGDDGRLYVVTEPTVTVLDGRSMATVAEFDLGIGGTWNSNVRGFEVVGSRLYVSYQAPNSTGDWGGAAAEIDLSGRRLRSWPFEVEVGEVRTTGAGWLYVNQTRGDYVTWAVPL